MSSLMRVVQTFEKPARLSTALAASVALLILAVFQTTTVAAQSRVQTGRFSGRWEIKELMPAGRIQFIFFLPSGRMTGSNYPYEAVIFRGLTRNEIVARGRTDAHFEIVREAGTFECDGIFQDGIGAGTFSFQPNPRLITPLEALGLSGISENELFEMALLNLGVRMVQQLQSAGVRISTTAQLLELGRLGLSADYIDAIHNIGFTPDRNELRQMLIHGIDIDFALEVRRLYPSASIQDLIQMRVHGLGIEFASDMRQLHPSAALADVLRARTGNRGAIVRRAPSPTPPGNPSRVLPRAWKIETLPSEPDSPPISDRIQLAFFGPSGIHTSSSVQFDAMVFRGLTAAQMESANRTAVRFEIVREAGTFACEGYFQSGYGSGTFIFYPNSDFQPEMESLGLSSIDDFQLIEMGLHDAGPQLVRALRAAGIVITTVAQLLDLRIEDVTPAYARSIRELYPTASAQDLINMRVQGILPEYVREIRKAHPSVSINEVIHMKIGGVPR